MCTMTMSDALLVESQVCYATPTRTLLYRLYDDAGTLLYVGVTSRRLSDRFGAHSRTQPWWSEVDAVAVEWFDERWMAHRAELRAIKDEAPVHNKTGSPSWHAQRALSEPPTEPGVKPHVILTPGTGSKEQGTEQVGLWSSSAVKSSDRARVVEQMNDRRTAGRAR